jgi:hypothetical protein
MSGRVVQSWFLKLQDLFIFPRTCSCLPMIPYLLHGLLKYSMCRFSIYESILVRVLAWSNYFPLSPMVPNYDTVSSRLDGPNFKVIVSKNLQWHVTWVLFVSSGRLRIGNVKTCEYHHLLNQVFLVSSSLFGFYQYSGHLSILYVDLILWQIPISYPCRWHSWLVAILENNLFLCPDDSPTSSSLGPGLSRWAIFRMCSYSWLSYILVSYLPHVYWPCSLHVHVFASLVPCLYLLISKSLIFVTVEYHLSLKLILI